MAAKKTKFLKNSTEPFLDFLDKWFSKLPVISMKSLFKQYEVNETALFCVDMTNGFCKKGALSSPRVGNLVGPVAQLLQVAEKHGINHYVLPQDSHPADSPEFAAYPPHCVEGSQEARTVQEITDLAHSYEFKVLPKRSINAALEPNLNDWLAANDGMRQFIVFGDCTDLCIYQLAMHLKLRANVRNRSDQVVVPANCVDTYDVPESHPGDFMHILFLYHMEMNGIKVVAGIE